MIKAAVYDMDDLMIDSYPLHMKAWDIILKKYGHSASEITEEMISGFVGMRVIETVEIIVKEFNMDISPEDLSREREDIFLEIAEKELETMPGFIESLEFFKKKGFKIAMASSATKKYIDVVLDKFKIREDFDVIVSGDDVSKGKPDPEVYRKASENLGLKPEESVVMEDAEKGVESAKNAGCKCIGVINTKTPTQDLSKADVVLKSLNEIITSLSQDFFL